MSHLLPRVNAVPFARDLARHGDRPAVVAAEGTLSYRELAGRVEDAAARLGPERRLIMLGAANTLDSLVTYLAALSAGHPVLLVEPDRPDTVRAMLEAYDPDVVALPGSPPDERRPVSAHAPHPDLALLLSTSGTTGSPKLVRLSHENLQANAASIAASLGIVAGDRAATTLPMHYCYGLSVINSHLLSGAGLILTGLSVADARFWTLLRAERATTFAGVPYTFELLDRVGFATMDLPDLRYVTQAGGRMPAERVVRYAAAGRRDGWDLVVMYGQTEATARMAYLPPHLAERRPEAIGVPVPGGSFRLAEGTGELVYSGPNVMLGYAEGPSDLALGRTVTELRTGDLARRAPDGLYEIVGRRSRFVKIYGRRIDPQGVEDGLARAGLTGWCTGDDEGLVVAVEGDAEAEFVRGLVAEGCGLPRRKISVRVLPELPRLPTGKPDYQALRESAESVPEPVRDLRALYARLLDRSDVTDDSTFVGLGGDSLSYVEMSLHLEAALGHLPADWHTRSIRELRRAAGRGRPARLRRLETGIALRAVAIVLIVGSHITLFTVRGGAHLLLAVAGYNFARFHLTSAARRERRDHLRASLTRLLVPIVAWIAVAAALTEDYHVEQALLLHSLLGRDSNYWFVEVVVYVLLAAVACLSVPAIDRVERRLPFAVPAALVVAGLVTRYDLVHAPRAIAALWLFPLGWAAAKASTRAQRCAVTAALVTVPGYFGAGETLRETLIVGGLALLIWCPTVPSLAVLNRLAGLLAGATLYIYLTHWQVYPLVDGYSEVLALAVSIAAGVAYAALATRVMRLLRRSNPVVRQAL